ncbi:DUF3618 domain-containing protein [uncultured Corynebacterium sp.]|uniref:DUF3618 domain-containing protein n=1 Tax=uncultured Corynebacterium sp. TaxID=159447 RepID=UPI0025912FE2|nr:DUF3618 domain-containing protein [uncultured Corynebacterium sp.]
MARDIHDIERDIERTRGQLASTLDELAARTSPSTLADNAKGQAAGLLQDEKVQKVLMGIGAGVAALVAVKILNGRKRKKELKELQKLLARR